MSEAKILFIGNFVPEFSTENDLLKALNNIGESVVTCQESSENPLDKFDETIGLVLWCHTHGWDQTDSAKSELLVRCAKRDIPTVGYTLDLFRGLRRHDPSYVKYHNWFQCKYFFQPDEITWLTDQLESRGGAIVFHLPPAINKDFCYIAERNPDSEAYNKIIFVGSKLYHPEWPWRQKLLEFLSETYKDRFIHYDHSSGMRGAKLNQLYADAAVVVGDSCFADRNSPYTSDRLFESVGRGANLAYPFVKNHGYLSPWQYIVGNLEHLESVIDAALKHKTHPVTVEKITGNVEWIKKVHTYDNRMTSMLDIVAHHEGW